LNSLTSYSGIINAKELGFFNNYIATNSKKNIYYLLNVEVFNKKTSEDYVIFQGHHNNRDYLNFDMILPSTTWLEKSGSYLNCFGILQETQYCSLPSNNVKSDKKIINRFFWLFKNFFMKENLNKKYKFFGHNSFEDYLDWCNIKKKVMLSNITTNNVLEFSNTHNYLNKKIFKNQINRKLIRNQFPKEKEK
jgi:anaerobic selenocysteine-containing dehydrogenase